jgi:RsiW-degrading membrane proteinase PrsW (M82 family)
MNLSLLGLAIAPGLAIAIYVYWRDKFDREPRRLMIWAFILGALSIIPAVLLESTWTSQGFTQGHTIIKTAFYAFVVVGFSEELSKYLFLRFFFFKKSAFNEPYDGITYSVMVSMGFATLENVLYAAEGGFSTAVMRIFTAVPAHAAFAVIMGYFVGMAKFDEGRKNLYLITGVLFAAALHGMYDFSLMQKQIPGLQLIGALLSLYLGIRLSLRAIRIHQRNSPFRNGSEKEELESES